MVKPHCAFCNAPITDQWHEHEKDDLRFRIVGPVTEVRKGGVKRPPSPEALIVWRKVAQEAAA